jgi:hypothetical protein
MCSLSDWIAIVGVLSLTTRSAIGIVRIEIDARFLFVDSKHFTTTDHCSDHPMLVLLAHVGNLPSLANAATFE